MSFILCISGALMQNTSATGRTAFLVLIYTAINFAVGLTTFLLPQSLYPYKVRGTLNGLSASGGKLGGAIGAAIFATFSDEVQAVLLSASAVAAVGFAVTWFFIPSQRVQP